MLRTLSLTLSLLTVVTGMAFAATPVSVRAVGSSDPRVAWGVARLKAALTGAGIAVTPSGKTVVEIAVNPAAKELTARSRKAEGYRLIASAGKLRVVGFDAAGAMYGCLELAQRIGAAKRLPQKLDLSDGPAMSLRGTSILLMKQGSYDYPITPAEFPFFYDKKLWEQYLDSLAENRYNYIALWNGHPFDYFVELDKYPETQAALGMEQIRRNRDMLLWLTQQAARRNIWLMFEFYNIHTSVPFQKAHNLPAWNSVPTPLLTDYTSTCIEQFVKAFPNVGLYICPGEALELKYTDSWINDVILPAVRRTGKTPPIIVRAWGIDLAHMKKVVGGYPRLYTERKYNVEMVAGTEVDPENADWARLSKNHIVSLHMAANLEPYRWGSPSYVQKCLQSTTKAGATGFHVYPRKAWRWPYGADIVDQPELQWNRDWLWFESWGRYSWDPNRDPKAERAYWLAHFSEHYGSAEAARHLLDAFDAEADVLPAIQRLIWLGNDNHTLVSAGIKLDQLAAAKGIPFLPVPGMVRIPQYLEALRKGEKPAGTTPIELLEARLADAKRALAEADLGAKAAERNIDDAEALRSDAEAVTLVAGFYHHKMKALAAKMLFDAGIDRAKSASEFLTELEASVVDYRRLARLTRSTYESLSDVPAWNPERIAACPYHWLDALPILEKELAAMKDEIAAKAPELAPADLGAVAKKWEKNSPIRRQMYDFVLALTQTQQDKLRTLDAPELRSRRKADLQQRLLHALGLDPLPERTPLNARSVGKIDYPDYTLEKITYEAWPGIPVSAHLYLPKNAAGKLPCVLYSCGHWYNGKTDPNPRSFCVGMVRQGIAVLIYDPMGQGERFADREHGHLFPILAGLSQEGFMVWESVRSVDYLLTRPEIDAKRIGMTGASGGGLNTVFTAPVENRLAAVAPVCYPTTYSEFLRAMDGHDWNGGFDLCNQVPGVISYADSSDLMACVAPKPQLQISATKDGDFPVAGARETAKRLSALYASVSPGKFSYVEVDAGHGYDKTMREAAYGFFLKFLAEKGDGSPVVEAPMTLEPWDDPKLRCFADGSELAGPRLERLVRAMIPETLDLSTPGAMQDPSNWMARAVIALREHTSPPVAAWQAMPAEGETEQVGEITLKRLLFAPEPGITIPVVMAAHTGAMTDAAVIVVSRRSKCETLRSPLIRRLLDRGLVLYIADLRGIGESEAGEFEIGTDLWMLGRTFQGEWTADIKCLARTLMRTMKVWHLGLVGLDGMGDLAILAAASVNELDCVFADSPLASYRELLTPDAKWGVSSYLPGALRQIDIPLALAAIAPRRAMITRPVNGKHEFLTADESKRIFEPATTIYARRGIPADLQILPGDTLDIDQAAAEIYKMVAYAPEKR